MKDGALESVRRIGKIGQIIMNIGKALVIVAIVLITAAIIGLASMPDDSVIFDYAVNSEITVDADKLGIKLDAKDINSKLNGSVNVGQIEFQLDDASVKGNKLIFTSNRPIMGRISSDSVIYIIIICDIILAITLVSLFFAGSLCKAFRECESPFDSEVIRKMRNFAFSLIPWVLMNSVSNSIRDTLYDGELNIRITIDLKMVVVVLSVLALTAVFKYGAILQKESDETL